ncbi:TonB-dependent receptor domain-containing protein [Larkinella bovis]|uniref:TonB-dependent receptor domain-containing protein n=1 Tax=Larkinella bovis TaxID=683041 RepID=A0ABW0IHD2_9BACT
MKRLFAVLCLLLTGFSSPGQPLYTVKGSVFEEGRPKPLFGVHVFTPGQTAGTVTDPSGFFSLTLPARDSLTLVFSCVGYQTVRQTIPFRQNQQLSVFLPAGQTLAELTVRPATDPEATSRNPQMSQIGISARQLEKIPALLGEKDLLRVLQLLPGVQKGSEGNTGIYVRGGGPDQNLVLLDEAVLYNSGHLLGFFSAFNGSALRNVELTKGGFPARFGGRLSSVIEVNTKEGNAEKLAGEASLGLVSSRLLLEGPLGKSGSGKQPLTFLLAGRRTYIDLITRPFATSRQSGATQTFFYDLNARLTYTLGARDRLFWSGFRSRDAFVNHTQTGNQPLQGSLNWHNTLSTLRWHHRISEQAFVSLSFLYSQYQLKVANDGSSLRDTASLRYELRYRSGIRDIGLKYALEFGQDHHRLHFGLQTIHHRFTPGAVVTTGNVDPATAPRFFIDALESGLYAEDTWQPARHWHLNAGFRLNHFLQLQSGTLPTGGKPPGEANGPGQPRGRPVQYLNPDPRLSMAYQLDSSFSVKMSFAMMNQYAHLLSNTGLGLPADLWIPTTLRIRPQQARQVAIGFAKDFLHPDRPDRNLTVTLEGYYKILKNSISFAEGTSFLTTEPARPAAASQWENNITSGRGWAYGSELFAQKKTGRLSGWVGYTLSWTWWQFPALNGGVKFHPRYDRRHDASIVGIYEIRPGLTFSWTWVYGTGQALTLPVARFSGYENRPASSVNGNPQEQLFGPAPNVKEYGARNGFRAEAYHRLDIGWQFRKQRKALTRTWELGLYNMYNRRNPFYYSLEARDQGAGRHSKSVLYKYSLFPVVPSVSYTLSF